MEKILIIEDNKDVNDLLKETLIRAGYDTDEALDGISGMKKIREKKYDFVILDIMLPYKSGDIILKEMRQFTDVPVMVLSAKEMVGTKVDLLKAGADDYVTKPFDLEEVLVRIEAILRRKRIRKENNQVLECKEIKMYIDENRVIVNNVEIDLALKEFQMLRLFLENPEKVFSKSNLYESVWNEEYLGDDNTIKAHLSTLRSKIKKQIIQEST